MNDRHHRNDDELIEEWMRKRADYRKQTKWMLADEIKQRLERDFDVEICDYCDKPSTWRNTTTAARRRTVTWTNLSLGSASEGRNIPSDKDDDDDDETEEEAHRLPIILATVDSPPYRARLQDTVNHLSNPSCQENDCHSTFERQTSATCSFEPIPYNLLELTNHPYLVPKTVVFEGWRTVLLPRLLLQQEERVVCRYRNCSFVLVAEDDARLGRGVTARRIRAACVQLFHTHPEIHVVSLGHAWASLCKPFHKDKSTNALLLTHLEKGGGVHGATLLAVRYPNGVQRLLRAMNRSKATHFDQFLFHSASHDLKIALCDPPLVGWAKVETTLTTSASGHRRRGGGRNEFVPFPPDSTSCWVVRRVKVQEGGQEMN